jgi:hypothetical protein
MASNRNMRLFTAQVEEPDLRSMIKEISASSSDQTRAILEFTKSDVLTFLRSYTNVYRPPRYERKFRLDAQSRRIKINPGSQEDWRPAHPGGWADVEYDLAEKYFSRLVWTDGAWELILGNYSDHAVYVEQKDGFFVLESVLDPGGPVFRSIQRAIKALGLKDWEVKGAAPLSADEGLLPRLIVSPKTGKTAPTPDLGNWR